MMAKRKACVVAFCLFGCTGINLFVLYTVSSGNDPGRHWGSNDAYLQDLAAKKGNGTQRPTITKDTMGADSAVLEARGDASAAGTLGMSACLLIKDDLNRLVEWLAYHYHILPLRHLIVAVDPTSKTSPSPILDRWRESGMGMEIIEWSDRDYMVADMSGAGPMSDEEKVKLFIFRQLSFVYACADHHRKNNRTWVAMVDSDEYIAFNAAREDDPKTKFKPGEREREIAGRKRDPSFRSTREQKISARESIPSSMTGNRTIMEFIMGGERSDLHFDEACVTLPRLFYGAVEGTPEELSGARAEELGFNATKFNTLRFFRHAKKGELDHNRYAKVIADVSRLSVDSLQEFIGITRKAKSFSQVMKAGFSKSIHMPFEECKRPFTRHEEAFLVVAHYLGSWEEYSFRSDVRRSRKVFDGKSKVAAGVTYDMQPWLYHFVKAVGSERAHYLLDGVGELHGWEPMSG